MKYTGPADPIPTEREPVSDRTMYIFFVLGFAVVLLDVFWWRP